MEEKLEFKELLEKYDKVIEETPVDELKKELGVLENDVNRMDKNIENENLTMSALQRALEHIENDPFYEFDPSSKANDMADKKERMAEVEQRISEITERRDALAEKAKANKERIEKVDTIAKEVIEEANKKTSEANKKIDKKIEELKERKEKFGIKIKDKDGNYVSKQLTKEEQSVCNGIDKEIADLEKQQASNDKKLELFIKSIERREKNKETLKPEPESVSTPTSAPTSAPTTVITTAPTSAPTSAPTTVITTAPTSAPTSAPTTAKTTAPTSAPTKPSKDYVKFKIAIGQDGLKIEYPDLSQTAKYSLKDLKKLDKWSYEEIKAFLDCPSLKEETMDLIDPTLMTAFSEILKGDKVPKEQLEGFINRYLHSLVSDKKLEGAKALKDVIEYDRTNLDYLRPRNLFKRMIHKKQYDDIKDYADIAEEMGIAEIKPDQKGKIRQFFSDKWNKIPLVAARKEKTEKTEETRDPKYSDPKNLTDDQKALAEAMEKYRKGEIGYQEEVQTGFKGKMASFKKGLSYTMMSREDREDARDQKEINKARANAFARHTTIEDNKDSKPKTTSGDGR